jgi:hypothetical protein
MVNNTVGRQKQLQASAEGKWTTAKPKFARVGFAVVQRLDKAKRQEPGRRE